MVGRPVRVNLLYKGLQLRLFFFTPLVLLERGLIHEAIPRIRYARTVKEIGREGASFGARLCPSALVRRGIKLSHLGRLKFFVVQSDFLRHFRFGHHDTLFADASELRLGSMPPAGKRRPNAEEMVVLQSWLDHVLSTATGEAASKHMARVTVHRLNRTEYNNTIRDLLGIELRLAESFPADDIGYGFDNIGDVLSLPPLLIEKYLAAATQAVQSAFGSPDLRRQLLQPAPDKVPPAYRGFSESVREEARKVPHKSPPDLSPPDPRQKKLVETAKILRAFADRAYRRPITNEELTRLLQFVEASQGSGDDFEGSLRLAMEAVLVSPSFLFVSNWTTGPPSPMPFAR